MIRKESTVQLSKIGSGCCLCEANNEKIRPFHGLRLLEVAVTCAGSHGAQMCWYPPLCPEQPKKDCHWTGNSSEILAAKSIEK